jgi:methionine-rich copper-binding protein CopC
MIRIALIALALTAAAPASAQHGSMDHGAMDHGGHHAMTIAPSIADGAEVATSPTELRLVFEPAMRLASASLTTATGERIPIEFDAAAVTTEAVVTFEALTPDTYTFAFSADAGDHDMPGRITFTVR